MIHRRSIVYNIQWCGIIYVCTYTRVTHTEKRKSKIFRGLRPLDPRQGLCPCTPPGALRRAPGPHPKSARAPRTCLPPMFAPHVCPPCLPPMFAHVCPWTPPKIGSRSAHMFAPHVRSAHIFAPPPKYRLALTRSLCALRAHVCPKKNRTPAIQKNRLALRARYVRYAHMFAPP